MTDEVLVAKTVFGETTLKDALEPFGNDLAFHIHSEDDAIDIVSVNWAISDSLGNPNNEVIQFYGLYDMDFEFDLSTKVKIHKNEIRFEYDGKDYTLSIFQKVNFNSFLPPKN